MLPERLNARADAARKGNKPSSVSFPEHRAARSTNETCMNAA